jgi:hypothetical protein
MNGSSILTNSEVTNISSIGFWVIIEDKEYFIAFKDYPEFKNIPVQDVFEMKMLSPDQLCWEKHDIDIELSALENPNLFPLAYRK